MKPLAKSVLIPLGLPAAASTINVASLKKIFGSGLPALIISDKEMNYIMKIFKISEHADL